MYAQLAYEPFNYPVNTAINGQNGGTGWAGPWLGTGDYVVNGGAATACFGVTPSGNALGPTSGPASFRSLASPVRGAAGTSLLLRAVIRSNVKGSSFTQATLGNSSGGTFIIGELSETDPRAANWALQNGAGVFYSKVPVAADIPTCLFARIDFGVSGGMDRMRFWVNPNATAYLSAVPDVDVTNAHLSQFSGVFWQTQQHQELDGLRVDVVQPLGEVHTEGVSFELAQIAALPPPAEAHSVVSALTREFCNTIGETCPQFTLPAVLPSPAAIVQNVKGSHALQFGMASLFSIIEQANTTMGATPGPALSSLAQYDAALDKLESDYSSQLIPSELAELSGDIAMARSSGHFWASIQVGGLGGMRFLKSPVTSQQASKVKWWKVVAADVIGGVFGGGIAGAVGGSVGSLVDQLLD